MGDEKKGQNRLDHTTVRFLAFGVGLISSLGIDAFFSLETKTRLIWEKLRVHDY